MLPSYKYILTSTLLASFFAVYGLVYNDTISLLVATIVAPTSESYFNIVKYFITNNTFPLLPIITYTFIGIFIPIFFGLIFGIIFTYLKNKYPENTTYSIPSENMLDRLDIHPINLFFNIIIPFIVCFFLPYAIEKNNITLIIGISIALSFVAPLINIGLIMGTHLIQKMSNYKQLKENKKNSLIKNYKLLFLDEDIWKNKLKLFTIDNGNKVSAPTKIKLISDKVIHNNRNYIIPIAKFISNLLAIILISFITLKHYKKKGKLGKI